jgi:hypothetical protein
MRYRTCLVYCYRTDDIYFVRTGYIHMFITELVWQVLAAAANASVARRYRVELQRTWCRNESFVSRVH